MAGIDIPGGLQTDRHGKAIKGYLENILGELRNYLGNNVGRVTSRLNCSNTEQAIPVWAGTVEDSDVQKHRANVDVGDSRFGRINRSVVYEETVTDGRWGLHERDWTLGFSEKDQDPYGPGQAYGPKGGCMSQLYIAIRVPQGDRNRHVGTITVGFKNNLNDQDKIKASDIMKNGRASKEYVNYLVKTSNFNLGGPVF